MSRRFAEAIAAIKGAWVDMTDDEARRICAARGEFADMSDAFAACRGLNKPMRVTVDGEAWTVFPSGAAVPILPTPTTPTEGSAS